MRTGWIITFTDARNKGPSHEVVREGPEGNGNSRKYISILELGQ